MAMEPDSQTPESEAKFWAKTVSSVLKSIDSILGKLGAVLPWFKGWLERPVILPSQQSHWWHMGRSGDKPAMQIATYWYVTNRTDKPINILNAYIKHPRSQGMVLTKDTRSAYHGSYPVPPHSTTDLHADFWITPPIRKAGKPIRISIEFVDQNGHKRTVRNVEVKSDFHRRKKEPVKLKEEAVYRLEHDVEKKVAATLKDEVTRYKKFGRRHGELGSLHAVFGGRQIKQIYGDGWSHSNSGQRLEIATAPETGSVRTENGDALVQFFESLDDDSDSELFVNSLLARFSRGKEYYCVSYLILYVLTRIRFLGVGLSAADISLRPRPTLLQKILRVGEPLLEPHQRHGLGDMLGLLNGFLRYEHSFFTDIELDQIESFVDSGDEFGDRILEKINSARSYRLTNPA